MLHIVHHGREVNQMKDTYKEVRTIAYPNMVARVHIPDLTEDERNRRMRQIAKAAEALIKASIDAGKERGNEG